MDKQDLRKKQIKKASWVGITGNAILSVLKISVGFIAGSLALVGDGIDSLADIVTSIISLFAARIMSEPPDREHPWGHGRAETIATRLIGFSMFLAGFQLLISSGRELIFPSERALPSQVALVVVVISIVTKTGLALYKHRLGKKIESSLLIADAKNMRNDVFLSLGVLVGITLCRLTGNIIFDSLIAILLALYIMHSAIAIFRESSSELMDGMEDSGIYETLFKAVLEVEGAQNPHRCRIRKINTLFDIDLDIEVDGNITVTESHDIATKVEDSIKKRLPNIYDIMVHIEPAGDCRGKEQFGLSPENDEF